MDWPSYLAKQDLPWNTVPQLWDEAPFVGNGVMGSMIFQEDKDRLVIQIGRGDVQEHRTASGRNATGEVLPDSSRLPVGYFTLDTVGEIKGCDLRLNLWDAEITGTISTDRGELDIHLFIHSEQNLLVVKTPPGNAQGVARGIDQADWSEVMGTIAGDDTILIIYHNESQGSRVERRLKLLARR